MNATKGNTISWLIVSWLTIPALYIGLAQDLAQGEAPSGFESTAQANSSFSPLGIGRITSSFISNDYSDCGPNFICMRSYINIPSQLKSDFSTALKEDGIPVVEEAPVQAQPHHELSLALSLKQGKQGMEYCTATGTIHQVGKLKKKTKPKSLTAGLFTPAKLRVHSGLANKQIASKRMELARLCLRSTIPKIKVLLKNS